MPFNAPGLGWQPNTVYKPGTPIRSDDLNSIAAAAARINGTPFECDGLHTASRSYLSYGGNTDAGSTIFVFLLLESMGPGSYAEPFISKAKMLSVSDEATKAMSATNDEFQITNYSGSIYAPVGGLVFAFKLTEDNWVAIGSAC